MKVAIIGAGAAGLAAAYDLSKAGHHVTLYEAESAVGGLAGGFKAPHWDWSVEKFYHHWFESDSEVLNLIREIGCGDRVLFPRPKTVVYHAGRFYPLDASLGALWPRVAWLDNVPGASLIARALLTLSYPGLSLLDKLRNGLVGLYLVLTPQWKPLESVTAHAWLNRWVGERGYRALWEPLLVGKFGEDNYRDVNMAWFWARIHKRSARLGTFVGGFQAFFDTLADKLRQQGVQIRLNTPVVGVNVERSTFNIQRSALQVRTATDGAYYDAVIATISPRGLVRLAPQLPAAYTQQLLQLKSMGAVVLILALEHQLSQAGFYWHNLPKGQGFPFLAMVEHTNYVGPEHLGGDHIVYCGDYLDPDHEYFRLSKEELLARFLPTLKRFNPNFEPGWVKASWLFKATYAQPVPPINHSRNIPAIRTPIAGLYFASMSQVYPWDRGTNYAVELGRRTARLAMEDYTTSESPG